MTKDEFKLPTGLTWKDLACRDAEKTPYPDAFISDKTRLQTLAKAFQAIRAVWGKPIQVDSAFRTMAHHKAIYAKLKKPVPMSSQHLDGRALDLKPPKGVSVREFYDTIVRLADLLPQLGIRFVQGYARDGFVHVDVRPTRKLSNVWVP